MASVLLWHALIICVCAHVNICTRVYIHMHAHTFTHTHTHMLITFQKGVCNRPWQKLKDFLTTVFPVWSLLRWQPLAYFPTMIINKNTKIKNIFLTWKKWVFEEVASDWVARDERTWGRNCIYYVTNERNQFSPWTCGKKWCPSTWLGPKNGA